MGKDPCDPLAQTLLIFKELLVVSSTFSKVFMSSCISSEVLELCDLASERFHHFHIVSIHHVSELRRRKINF